MWRRFAVRYARAAAKSRREAVCRYFSEFHYNVLLLRYLLDNADRICPLGARYSLRYPTFAVCLLGIFLSGSQGVLMFEVPFPQNLLALLAYQASQSPNRRHSAGVL